MNDLPLEQTRIEALRQKLATAPLPSDLQEKLTLMLSQATSSVRSGQIALLEQTEKYVNLVLALPWEHETQDDLDLSHAKQIFNKNHYGMSNIKDRIVEYLSVLTLQSQKREEGGVKQHQLRTPILCFVGLVGTGKTTLAYSIAEAMGRVFIRIPFGGMGSVLDIRGQSRVHPDAEAGRIIKALARYGAKNPVILLDEIDRIAAEARADIMGILVELLDPEQNAAFTDHYLDYPFDLSHVLFIATANNTKHIATAVLDRLELVQMPSYTDEEKITIGRNYVFPRERAACGLNKESLTIDEDVWPAIVRPLGYDAGIRTLERTINGICRKVARMIVEKKGEQFHITQENVKTFLPV